MKSLRRSTDKKIVAGVCAGMAEWLGWRAGTVRILFVVGSFIPVIPGFIVYFLLWAVVPAKPG